MMHSETLSDGLSIFIEDSGCGLSESLHEDIWRKGRSHFFRGTGLGLHIVSQSIKALGGAVSLAYSEKHFGSIFQVDLPTVNAEPVFAPCDSPGRLLNR